MKRTLNLPDGRRAALSIALAFAAFGSSAQTPAPTSATPVAQSFTLSNGMTLIVRPDRRAPTVAHMLWVRVGSIDEVDGTSGVAHVLEHMMFKGTRDLKPGEFSRRIAALGGRDNAFTSRDYTAYFQQVPNEKLAEMMRLEADRMRHLNVDPKEFAQEIKVVMEERRMRTDDNPQSKLFEQMNATAFQAHPYRRPIIGWMNDLENMSAADAKAWLTALANNAGNGSTNYDDALIKAMNAYDSSGKLTGAGVQNVSYFLSDGQPTLSNANPGSNNSGSKDGGLEWRYRFCMLFLCGVTGQLLIRR